MIEQQRSKRVARGLSRSSMAGAAWGDVMDDGERVLMTSLCTAVRSLVQAEEERDEARAALATQRALWGNIGPETYQTWLRDRDALVAKQADELEAMRAERDEARAALAVLVAGLGLDDAPRRAAIDTARALAESWRAK